MRIFPSPKNGIMQGPGYDPKDSQFNQNSRIVYTLVNKDLRSSSHAKIASAPAHSLTQAPHYS